MHTLTQRQQQVFDFIVQSIEQTGLPPTRAEIAQGLGFNSANAAEDHLRALAKKGAIELISGTSRGIKVAASPTANEAPASALHLPLIGQVAAGHPIFAQAHIERYYQCDPNLFFKAPDYLLKVQGMSMKDAGILDGDLIAVKKTQQAQNGEIVVARLIDEVTIKRYFFRQQFIELHAENPEYTHIIIQPDDPFELEGIAVGLIRLGYL